MRYFVVAALFSLGLPAAMPQAAPAGWKVVKDPKGACRISVPEDWAPSTDNSGSAVFQDATIAIAVVTSQPGQTLKPLSEALLKLMRIPKEKVFENTAKRVFYQDKIARNSTDSSAFSAMVPGKNGTCSSRVVFASGVSEETARKITLSLGPATE